MISLVALGLCTATLVAAVDITCKPDLFVEKEGSCVKLVPKDFTELEKNISPSTPLLIFFRSAEAEHNTDEYTDTLKERYQTAAKDMDLSQFSTEKRLENFDPDITQDGLRHVETLKQQLLASGWAQFIENHKNVQYVTSPESRTIQTAMKTFPQAIFTVDDGVRNLITPLGPDQRRSMTKPVVIGGRTYESLEDKFHEFKANLVIKMANPSSYTIPDRFGLYRDEDLGTTDPRMESGKQLRDRMLDWINMINPASAKIGSAAQKLIDTVVPDSLQAKVPNPHPTVYVIFTNSRFINEVIDYFDLTTYKNKDNQANHCEAVPILVHFSTNRSEYVSPNPSSTSAL